MYDPTVFVIWKENKTIFCPCGQKCYESMNLSYIYQSLIALYWILIANINLWDINSRLNVKIFSGPSSRMSLQTRWTGNTLHGSASWFHHFSIWSTLVTNLWTFYSLKIHLGNIHRFVSFRTRYTKWWSFVSLTQGVFSVRSPLTHSSKSPGRCRHVSAKNHFYPNGQNIRIYNSIDWTCNLWMFQIFIKHFEHMEVL